ncbi:unnamed protein product [Lepidochelys kempii]
MSLSAPGQSAQLAPWLFLALRHSVPRKPSWDGRSGSCLCGLREPRLRLSEELRHLPVALSAQRRPGKRSSTARRQLGTVEKKLRRVRDAATQEDSNETGDMN